jgi:CelD/BcsL family acetyltransferase involved in cellulose biosynthesis
VKINKWLEERLPVITVSEYGTATAFESLRADWIDLLERSDNASVFSTWEWMEAMCKHGAPGRRPWLLAARDSQQRLVGLLPLAKVDGPGVVRIIEVAGCHGSGYPVGDYGGPISVRGMESAVWKAMLDHLKKSRWSIIDLRNCRAGNAGIVDRLTAIYESAASANGWTTRIQSSVVCRLIPLPDTFDGYLASLSSNSRQNLRRKMRKCADAGIKIEPVDSNDEASRVEALNALFNLHQQRWANNPSGGSFSNEQMRALHRYLAGSLASAGMVDLRAARSAEGEIIGVIYNFRRDGVGYFYTIGTSTDARWENLSLGVCLLASSIQAAIEAGCHTFDMLRGDHDYKAHFGGYTVSNLRVTVYRYGWLPKIQAIAAAIRSRATTRIPARLEGSATPE